MSDTPEGRMNEEASYALRRLYPQMAQSELGYGTFYLGLGRDLHKTYKSDEQKVTVQYYVTSDEVVSGTVYPL